MVAQAHAVSVETLLSPLAFASAHAMTLPCPYLDPDAWLGRATTFAEQHGLALNAALQSFVAWRPQPPALCLSGWTFPVLPATPLDVLALPAMPPLAEFWLGVVASCLGTVLAYADEQDGHYIRQICPTPAHEALLTNQNHADLGWHTENASLEHPPDYILLLCLRADQESQAVTSVASAQHLLACLPPSLHATCWEPVFATERDLEHGGGPGLSVALLSGDPAWPTMRLDTSLMHGQTAEAAHVLALVREYLGTVAPFWRLLPGDMLLIDNRHTAHNRSAFAVRYDGTDRWLQQCYVWASTIPNLVTLGAATP